MEMICRHKAFLSFGVVWAWLICPLTTSMFIANMLLWWTLDSAPLRLVIKPKIPKEALQWRFERRTQVDRYVVTSIKPNKRIEPTMQYTSLL